MSPRRAKCVAAVGFAPARTSLDLAVRGGGHSVPGFGTVDDGVVVRSVGDAAGVAVDPAAYGSGRGRQRPGADFNDATAATGSRRPGGSSPRPGSAGSRSAAASATWPGGTDCRCDNLDLGRGGDGGRPRRHRQRGRRTPDLFWAMRGGGGNFGVVTSFEFRLHPVKEIYGGPMFFERRTTPDRASVLSASSSPTRLREFGGFSGLQIAPPLPFIPEDRHGKHVSGVRGVLGRARSARAR